MGDLQDVAGVDIYWEAQNIASTRFATCLPAHSRRRPVLFRPDQWKSSQRIAEVRKRQGYFGGHLKLIPGRYASPGNNQDYDQWESSQRIAEVRGVARQIGVHLKLNPGG